MNIYYLLGMLCGVAVGLVFFAIFMKVTKKDGSMKCKFDERQITVRGQGFKYGFFTLVACNMIYSVMADEKWVKDASTFAVMFSGIGIAILVYVSYCIWNEGYFSLNENPKRVLIGFGIITVFNLFVGLKWLMSEEFKANPILDAPFSNLWAGIIFAIIIAEILVKQIYNRREAE